MLAALNRYDEAKIALARIGQALLEVAGDAQNLETERTVRSLLSKLAGDSLVMAILGQFSRGKTSLMNALLGASSLPVGIVPCTSVITEVRYGTQESVVLWYKNSSLPGRVSLVRLRDYVTEEANPGNQKEVSRAEIHLPIDSLRSGLVLVDTPGVGSTITANTETTRDFLPQIDAAVLVTSIESPLTAGELQFFLEARQHVGLLYVVLNKIDLVGAEEAEAAARHVQSQLQERGISDAIILKFSAKQALEARLEKNSDLLKESGLPELESLLSRFVTQTKPSLLLENVCDRFVKLLEGFPVSSESEALTQRLDAWRTTWMIESAAADPDTEAPDHIPSAMLIRQCSICARVTDSLVRFLAHEQYALAKDESRQRSHAAEGGFCRLHSWHYSDVASPAGIAQAYPLLLEAIASQIESRDKEILHDRNKSASQNEHCSACRAETDAEQDNISKLVETLRRLDNLSCLRGPLCLPHFASVINLLPDGGLKSLLTHFEASFFRMTAHNLRRFSLKQSAFRRELMSDEESLAHRVAIHLVAGGRMLSSPAQQDIAI